MLVVVGTRTIFSQQIPPLRPDWRNVPKEDGVQCAGIRLDGSASSWPSKSYSTAQFSHQLRGAHDALSRERRRLGVNGTGVKYGARKVEELAGRRRSPARPTEKLGLELERPSMLASETMLSAGRKTGPGSSRVVKAGTPETVRVFRSTKYESAFVKDTGIVERWDLGFWNQADRSEREVLDRYHVLSSAVEER